MSAANILLLESDIDALNARAHADFHDDLRRGWHAQAVIAGVHQEKMKAAFEQARPLHNEALGQLSLVVDPWLYEEMRRQHGDDCWKDKGFRDQFARENPSADVRSRSRHTTILHPGLSPNVRTDQNPIHIP